MHSGGAGGHPVRRIPLRAAGTALLAGTVVLRAIRVLENLESVRRFYSGSGGPAWTPVELALFLGPYLTAISAIAALWLPRERAGKLGTVNACSAAFFVFEEGLIVFARAMDGGSGYIGAEPLCGLLALGVSILTVFRALRAGQK